MTRTMLMVGLALVTIGVIGAQESPRQNPDRRRGDDQPVERRRGDDAPQPPDEPRRRRNPDDAPQPPRGEGQPGRPGMMGMGPMQITSSGKFVYILRGNEILQFHFETLELIKKVTIPAPDRQPPPPPRDDGDRRDRPDRGERPDRGDRPDRPPQPPREPDPN